ncbi:MAG TPA: hypothetical protein VJY34_12695 [Roseiarcus sp.]|nr:hypothetical protein [Roseiarcus sp.]
MGLFDDEQKKKIAEATEAQQVALRVSVALLEFIADNPNSDIEVLCGPDSEAGMRAG